MTQEQLQADRDWLFAAHADYCEIVILLRKLRACKKESDLCPCTECTVIRIMTRKREQVWRAYNFRSKSPEESAGEAVIRKSVERVHVHPPGTDIAF